MSEKKPFSEYVADPDGNRNDEEALCELVRELDVRRRLYDRWVVEGRLSWVDADDRLRRHLSAVKLLAGVAGQDLVDKTVSPKLGTGQQPW